MFHRLIFALLLALATQLRAEPPLAASTIVIYNKSIPESLALAKFYAQQRGIARDHLVGLPCSGQEEISRSEYDETIANPLRDAFKERGWWTVNESGQEPFVGASAIHFVAVIKGVPLKIRSIESYPGDKKGAGPIADRNEASVDSELTLLAAYSHQISSFARNPYFQSFRAISDPEVTNLLLVCRLDAPSATTVRQMIVDAVSAEKGGLWGRAYVDGAHNTAPGLSVGDHWLTEITEQLHKAGIPVVYDDKPEIFPESYPITDCALYYGWYTANIAGPFALPTFRFIPGAIAVHIHSFSAQTLHDPNADWVGPLVTKGAAVSLGNVYEPYLQLTPQLNIFNDRLLHGFTFAESAYMSLPALSWMSVMVGDPLYRPYATWLQIGESQGDRDPGKSANDWKLYHDVAVHNAVRSTSEFRTAIRQTAARARSGPMMEDLARLEARAGHFAAALANFQLARGYYKRRDDIVRVVLAESEASLKLKKAKPVLELVRSTMRSFPDTPAVPLLRAAEREASGKPPISPTPKP